MHSHQPFSPIIVERDFKVAVRFKLDDNDATELGLSPSKAGNEDLDPISLAAECSDGIQRPRPAAALNHRRRPATEASIILLNTLALRMLLRVG